MIRGILKMGRLSSPRSWIGKPFTQGWPFRTSFQIVGKSVPFRLSALHAWRRFVTSVMDENLHASTGMNLIEINSRQTSRAEYTPDTTPAEISYRRRRHCAIANMLIIYATWGASTPYRKWPVDDARRLGLQS